MTFSQNKPVDFEPINKKILDAEVLQENNLSEKYTRIYGVAE
ncbi:MULTISPECIES: hypothetical protein [unclassified Okeania]|nr:MULTISPECIES: hypothetical protein [unclassified Okeania]